MSYETPGVAYQVLESIYSDIKKRAEEYAVRDDTKEFVKDRQFDLLERFYQALVTLEPLSNDVVGYAVACQYKEMQRKDPSLDGVHVKICIRSHGDNYGLLTLNLDADSTY